MITAAATSMWDGLSLSDLNAELQKRNASTQVATPKVQLVQRLLRIEAGHPLEDDMIQQAKEPAVMGSQNAGGENEDEEDFGLMAEDAAALANTIANDSNEGDKGAKGGEDMEEDFGIESSDEAELEALAVEVESPNLKRTRHSLESSGSDAKRQCVEAGELVVPISSLMLLYWS